MPRAFDRGVQQFDKDPNRSATDWNNPLGVIGDAATLYGEQIRVWISQLLEDGLANIFAGCTDGFINGLRELGVGDTDLNKIGTGLQNFVDDLLGILFCNLDGGLTPQFLISTVQNIVEVLGATPIATGLAQFANDLNIGGNGTLNDILAGLAVFTENLLEGVSFEGLADIINNTLAFFRYVFVTLGANLTTLLQPLAAFLTWVWESFGDLEETFLKPVINFLAWLWNGAAGGFAGLGDAVDTLLKPLVEWLTWLWTSFGTSVDTFLKPAFTWLEWLWDLFGDSVNTVLKPAFEFLEWLFGTLFAGALPALRELFTALKNAIATTGSMASWIDQIPLIGPIVSRLTGYTEADGIALDFTTLGNWADDLLTKASDLPAKNLKGSLPGAILSSIPIANINIDSLNLLSQGDFSNASTIDAANGWEWDSSTSHTTGGGAVKVTANGTLRELFSNQTIKVVAGDRINLSAYVKTSGFSGSGTSIVLSLIPFAGTNRYTVGGTPVTVDFASRGGSTEWVQMAGSGSTAPWTVPATVTSVRVRLAITSGATSGSVWFDDIDLHKTGLLGQSLVEYLTNAWENLWGGLVGTSGAGKTWADMLNAAETLRTFAGLTDTNLSGLQGDLLDAPATVLGSLFAVTFDGTKTVGDFLRLLYNALNKSSSTTPKTVDDVAGAAGTLKDTADQAALDAADAYDLADGAKTGTTNLRTSIIAGYTVTPVTANGTVWNKPAGLSEIYVAVFGGGAKGGTAVAGSGANGSYRAGGRGGQPGGFVASQLDVAAVPASVTCTIGAGNTSTTPTSTSFGSLLSSESAFKAYVAHPLGLIPTGGQPTAGGRGGSVNYESEGGDGIAGGTTSVGLVGGTRGVYGAPTGTNGGNGGTGLNFGLCQTGGSGGGGGGLGQNAFGPAVGGNGGNGGFPGGGGGGAGAASGLGETFGTPGNGGNGLILIIYKTANTVL